MDSTDSADLVDATGSADSTDSTDSADSADLADSTDSVDSTDNLDIFKRFSVSLTLLLKVFYLLVDYPLSYTWLNGEPQIIRKERYKNIFPGTYISESFIIVYSQSNSSQFKSP